MLNNGNSVHSSPAPDVLVAEGLCKSYGPRKALQGLTFTLKSGRILGFLGPNGAGKTTSIRILTTMMEPESGHFSIDGISSEYPEQIRRRIGVLPENLGFPRHMTGLEYLIYYGQLYGRTSSEARQNALLLLGEVGLHQRVKSLIGSYSHGMKQRLGIARALVNDPALILADEPTANLDSKIGHEIMRLLRRIAKEQGRSVVIVSHDQRIKDIADRVLWLEDGEFKETVTMAVDPVCGMSVEREKAVSLEWEGQNYYFCARGCRDEFMQDPQKSSAAVS